MSKVKDDFGRGCWCLVVSVANVEVEEWWILPSAMWNYKAQRTLLSLTQKLPRLQYIYIYNKTSHGDFYIGTSDQYRLMFFLVDNQ